MFAICVKKLFKKLQFIKILSFHACTNFETFNHLIQILHLFIKFCLSVDNAFLEAGEPALNKDDAQAEFDEEMQDLDQMVESFKICTKEQWGDPTFTFHPNARFGSNG